MLAPKVPTINTANTAGKIIQYESRQSSAALRPQAAIATSAIAVDTHRNPSRDGVTVMLTAPNDIASIEAIAATTERNSKTARQIRETQRTRILTPRTQRKKTTQMAER